MLPFRKTVILMALLLLACLPLSSWAAAPAPDNDAARAYSFVYLGDLHFDKPEHHDFEWVRANKPNDIRQIEGYVKDTEQYMPGLLQRVGATITSSAGRIAFVLQGGDLTEGLCGSQALQETQFRDVRALIRTYLPDTPFLAVKGNHDVTGPGARQAYENVMLPWLSQECGRPVKSASFYFKHGPDLFVFFDAYHGNDLDWLETTLSENPSRYVFVVMHPPAVPYNARSTWHVFSKPQQREVRERFLRVLGARQVILMTAHLHKYHVVARTTANGTFVQFSMSSVISGPETSVRDHLEGLEHYGPALVELEPEFQPDTEQQRRALLEEEKPNIAHFEYADLPGYAVVNVSDADIELQVYPGTSDQPWKSVSLVTLLNK